MMCGLDHCASYHTIKEIENEIKVDATIVNATPFGMSKNDSAATGVAWDNFIMFVETKNGKDALHETVGIGYQVLDNSQPSVSEDNQQNTKENTKLKKRKCLYSTSNLTIAPYRKKLKFVAHSTLELNDARRLKYEKTCDGISSLHK